MNGPTKDSYLKRAFIFLEDKEWDNATEYSEKALDIDPECAEAYFCKMLIDFKIPDINTLEQSHALMSISPNFRKAIKFANEEQAKLWREYSVKNIFNLTLIFLKEKKYGQALSLVEETKWNEEQILNLKDALVENELFAEAMKLLDTDNSKRFSSVEVFKISFIEDMFKKAEEFRNNKLYHTAYELYKSLEEYKDISQQIEFCIKGMEEQKALREELAVRKARKTISTAEYHTVAIQSNGKAIATKFMDKYRRNPKKLYHNQCGVRESSWFNLVAIDCNEDHTVALKIDGTVVSTNPFLNSSYYDGNKECSVILSNYAAQDNVSNWKNIIAISAGRFHTVGLKQDGTVVSTRYRGQDEYYFGQDCVTSWKNIIMIDTADDSSVGLTIDGNVVCTKRNSSVNWKDILYVFVQKSEIFGLRADGKLLRTSDKLPSDVAIDSVEVVRMSPGLAISLTKNAMLKASPSYKSVEEKINVLNEVASIAGLYNLIVLKKDGTVEALPSLSGNKNGECNVSDWKDIAQPPKEKTFSELLENEKARLKQFEEAKVAAAQAKKLELQQKKEEEQRKKAEAEAERKRIAEEKQRKKAMQEKYCNEGLCRHCGGTFKGLIFKVCTQCGHKKDY